MRFNLKSSWNLLHITLYKAQILCDRSYAKAWGVKKFQLKTEIQAEEPKVIKVYEAASCEC